MATIIDGKALSLKLKEEMKQHISEMKENGIQPKLVVVLVGNDSASQVYVRNKHKSARSASFRRLSPCRRRPPSRSCLMWYSA